MDGRDGLPWRGKAAPRHGAAADPTAGARKAATAGSHGRLTHEFITAILEDREPLVNIYEALAMTVPGIIAHQSALKDGETLKGPAVQSVGHRAMGRRNHTIRSLSKG